MKLTSRLRIWALKKLAKAELHKWSSLTYDRENGKTLVIKQGYGVVDAYTSIGLKFYKNGIMWAAAAPMPNDWFNTLSGGQLRAAEEYLEQHAEELGQLGDVKMADPLEFMTYLSHFKADKW